MEASPTLICVTPVKNEAWILDRFLQCASQWADHIILADQQSTDRTREIAGQYPKVTLIDNPSTEYDEVARQRLLLEAARRVPAPGRRILIALDADEMLTANWNESAEWQKVLDAPEGTILAFRWINVGPDFKRSWVPDESIPFGFVDDGSPHEGYKIHSRRLPTPAGAPVLDLKNIGVLHYQYTNWRRMKSKQRWYQCWERLNHPEKRPITIFRQYNFMDAAFVGAGPLKPEWLSGYEQAGIDMRTVVDEPYYHWDIELVKLFQEHGVERFKRLSIWDTNWAEVGRAAGMDVNGQLEDPRSRTDRAIHAWLAGTQKHMNKPAVRLVQKALQPFGW